MRFGRKFRGVKSGGGKKDMGRVFLKAKIMQMPHIEIVTYIYSFKTIHGIGLVNFQI